MVDVLVTGASGFIGKALCKRLTEESISFHAARSDDGNVADPKTWEKYPRAKILVHLAGRSYVPKSWENPIEFLETNVIGTESALEYCRRHGSRMIFISAYIYGVPKNMPIREDHPVNPNNPYALSKHLAEQLCCFAVQTGQISTVTVLRLFNVYGPGQRKEFLIPSILNELDSKEKIHVLDLKPRRDYVYLDDVVDSIMDAMSLKNGFNVFNIGSGISYSVKEVVEIILQVAGASLPISSTNEERPQEIPEVRADFSRALTAMGWRPKTSFKEGISKILRYLATEHRQ